MGKKWVGRVYLGNGQYRWCGRFDTKRERDRAVALARVELETDTPEHLTCQQYADKWLVRYERDHKQSSAQQARYGLTAFLASFGHRPLRSITRYEAREWADDRGPSQLATAITMLNAAVDDELLERNPFRGLSRRSKGSRADAAPPTEQELTQLLNACSVHGPYAPMMRAMLQFAAYTGIRPGEMFALEWTDIDFDRMRVRVERRLYGGKLDTPKSGKARTIALTPPARDALLPLPKDTQWVFASKRGKRMSQPSLSLYWREVCIKANLFFDFYLSSRHFCAHYMWVKLGLPERVVVEQLGHVDDKLLKAVYGHGSVGALDEIDAAFSSSVTRLRSVPDANEAV